MEILLLILGLIALGAGALLWGADSRDSVNSEEWRRRAGWQTLSSVDPFEDHWSLVTSPWRSGPYSAGSFSRLRTGK
jgi:hypothetical protein